MPTSDDLVRGYALALFGVVQAEGELDRVEDELYRFGKILESNHELKQALSDRSMEVSQRIKVLEELLAGKVSQHTLALLTVVLTPVSSSVAVTLIVYGSLDVPVGLSSRY